MSVRRRTPFAQIPQWILQAEVSSHAKVLWAALDRFAGLPNGAIPSRQTLANEWLHASTDTVDRAKSELLAIGALTIESRPGTSNEYILEDRPNLGTGAEGTLGTGAERKRARGERAIVSEGENPLPLSAAEVRAALWDALVEATGIHPESHGEKSRFGMSVSELAKMDASPAEVLRRAGVFRDRYPGATVTDRALCNRWGELAVAATNGNGKRYGRGMTSEQIIEYAKRKGAKA